MESKGLKVNADKTETMVYARTAEPLQIKDKTDKALKQVKNFRYLGSVIHAQGGSEEDIKARIAAAWNKKGQVTLSNPRDVKACQNCSNSTCFVSFHRIPFHEIANA